MNIINKLGRNTERNLLNNPFIQVLLKAFLSAIFVARFSATFVALKLQLENPACKPAAISVRF